MAYIFLDRPIYVVFRLPCFHGYLLGFHPRYYRAESAAQLQKEGRLEHFDGHGYLVRLHAKGKHPAGQRLVSVKYSAFVCAVIKTTKLEQLNARFDFTCTLPLLSKRF